MNQGREEAEAAERPPADGVATPGQGGGSLWFGGTTRDRAIFLIAVAFSAFQIYTAAFSPLSSLVTRAVHVGFLLVLSFALFSWSGGGAMRRRTPWYDWALGALGFAAGL